VLDLFENGKIHRNEIALSPELTANFLKFWHRFVASDHHSNIALPFFHLTGDKFWHLMPNPGFEATIQARVKLRSLPALRSAVKYAYDVSLNGLALCKNHHWAFDHGWFGVDDDYRIVIPQERFMEEAAVESREMVAFRGEAIGLPREREFRPSLEGLRWHRERWGIKEIDFPNKNFEIIKIFSQGELLQDKRSKITLKK
jgi:predicted restriction endonuclease